MKLYINPFKYLEILLFSVLTFSFFLNWQTSVQSDYPIPSNEAYWQNGLSSIIGVISFGLSVVSLIFRLLNLGKELGLDKFQLIFNILVMISYLSGVVNNEYLHVNQIYFLGNGFYIFSGVNVLLIILLFKSLILNKSKCETVEV